MAEVMKPCPFCGGIANLRDYDYPRKPVFIDCDPCNLVIEGDDGTVESAIAAWNRRAPDATLLQVSDELREALSRTERNRDMWKGQCERQAAQLTDMREALRPFAAIQAQLDDPDISDDLAWGDLLTKFLVTGDFRRAARVLADKGVR